jgi:hypothetical protein
MGKSPGVKFEFGILPKSTNAPRVKFDFGPLNPKRFQWAPKMGKAPGVKFEFGRLPKRTNSPRVKFEFGPIKIVVAEFGGPQKLAKAPE